MGSNLSRIRQERMNTIEKAIKACGTINDEELHDLLCSLADASQGGTRSHLLDVLASMFGADSAQDDHTEEMRKAYGWVSSQLTNVAREVEAIDAMCDEPSMAKEA